MSPNVILVAIFVGVVGVFAVAAVILKSKGKSGDRLSGFKQSATVSSSEVQLGKKRERELGEAMADRVLRPLSKLMSFSGGTQSKLVERLVYAGVRRKGATEVFLGAKMAMALALPAAGASFYLWRSHGEAVDMGKLIMYCGAGLLLGMMLPNMWLGRKVRARQEQLRFSLPGALDLLVVCIESGLALDAALVRIGRELQDSAPELSEEIALLGLEISAGKPREECLRNLGLRTGVEEMKSLVACIVQSTKFGTNLANSLRIHAESLREKRRQDAEERAAKTTVKLLFPLVFFIFPTLFVVILGPAVVKVSKTFLGGG